MCFRSLLLGMVIPRSNRPCAVMDCYCDYELGLQHEFGCWSSIRNAGSSIDFSSHPRYIEIKLKGMIVWSIQAVPLEHQSSPPPGRRYDFNIKDVRVCSRTCILPDDDQAAGSQGMSLPLKYKHLGFDMVFRSAFTFQEALDRLEWYSTLFSCALSKEPGRRNRWLMILDAEITTVWCTTAREATDAAGKAAAGALSECPIPLDASYINIEKGEKRGVSFERWSIDGWSVADELWAASFSKQPENLVLRKKFLCQAAEEGNVLQWCRVEVHRKPHPSFEFEIDLQEFLEGDDVVLRIGIANHRPLRVRVSLTENVEVLCSQEGIERQTSLGLGYLLPDMVREHVLGALRPSNGIDDGANANVVEQLLQRVVRYLAFLGNSCIVCGSRRFLEVPLTSSCKNICRARRLNYAMRAACATKDDESSLWKRREQFVRCKFPDTGEGRKELELLLELKVVPVGVEGKTKENEIGYELAAWKVARLENCREIASKLGVEMSSLWFADEEK